MLNSTFLSSKFKLGIVAFFLLISNALSAQTYDANRQRVKFGGWGVTITNKVGTTGMNEGDIVLYENVITIGGQKIDAILKNIDTSSVSSFIAFDALPTTNAITTGRDSAFYAPQLNFKTTGGFYKFNVTFIKNGTYNSTTKSGTVVKLINVVLNTYDIDGNGTSGANQYNEFGQLLK